MGGREKEEEEGRVGQYKVNGREVWGEGRGETEKCFDSSAQQQRSGVDSVSTTCLNGNLLPWVEKDEEGISSSLGFGISNSRALLLIRGGLRGMPIPRELSIPCRTYFTLLRIHPLAIR